jgi:hypothetical protein
MSFAITSYFNFISENTIVLYSSQNYHSVKLYILQICMKFTDHAPDVPIDRRRFQGYRSEGF